MHTRDGAMTLLKVTKEKEQKDRLKHRGVLHVQNRRKALLLSSLPMGMTSLKSMSILKHVYYIHYCVVVCARSDL